MLYEVYSMWGSSECHPSRYPLWGGNADEPAYFRDAIERGCRFGVIASSDDHTSLPGSESILRYPGRALFGTYPHHGLAGIFAPSLDRASLWAAMRARRTLATTYGRPVLLFEAEGAQAGEEVEVTGHESAARARHLRVRYLPPFPERRGIRLAVLRNGRPMLEETLDRSKREEMCCLEAVDETTFDAVMIRGAPFSPRPFIAYSVRLDTRQGGTVWSSPIWFVR